MLDQFDTEDFFSDRDGSICGTAWLDVEYARFSDADIGGFDGFGVERCSLVYVSIGPLRISRSQLVEAFSEQLVNQFEEKCAERALEEAV